MLDFIQNIKEKNTGKKLEQKENSIFLDSPVPEFIPYACHYDEETILTKNGELLQIIKIEGFSHEKLGIVKSKLRDRLKNLVKEKINSNSFALTFHTIRKKQNLDTAPKFPSEFAKGLHSAWVKKNNWNTQFINELRITVVHSGMPLSIGYQNALQMVFLDNTIAKHEKRLASSLVELKQVVEAILQELSTYGPKKLTVKFDESIGYHSELLQFFASIIHLEESKISMPMADLSKHLAKYKIAFGNNVLEVRRNNGRFFASILSMKEFSHASLRSIDKFLQIQRQIVITQTVNFIPAAKGIQSFKYQDYVLNVSKDTKFRELSGLNKISPSEIQHSHDSTSFCESQATIMIIADTLSELELAIKEAYEKLVDIGIPVIREDLNLEHCFWSQLPGNFSYITRKNIMPSSEIGNFASLYNFPFGFLKSPWGESVCIIKTILGTPYFFNFHVEDSGHTIIIGEDDYEKSITQNFLLSETSKFNPRIFCLDTKLYSELFIRAMGGKYKVFSFIDKDQSIKINPLLLDDTKENREFLKYWFMFLLDKYSDPAEIDNYFTEIEAAIEFIFGLDKQERKLSSLSKFFYGKKATKLGKEILKKLAQWYGDGKFAHIFDNSVDELLENNQEKIFGLDATALYDTPMSLNLPVLSYLLYFFKTYYANLTTPSILAVASGNRLFNSVYFEKNLEYILDDLKSKNSMMLVSASFSSEKVNWSGIVGQVYQQKMATKIFLANNSAYENLNKIFSLSTDEQMYLQALSKDNNQLLLRQGDYSVVLEINLGSAKELKLMAYSQNLYNAAKKIILEKGEDPNVWLPEFYKQS